MTLITHKDKNKDIHHNSLKIKQKILTFYSFNAHIIYPCTALVYGSK